MYALHLKSGKNPADIQLRNEQLNKIIEKAKEHDQNESILLFTGDVNEEF